LLENPVAPDYIMLMHFEKEVSKDAYRMTAFLRFREVEVEDGQWFVAWYEPEHDTLEINGKFFTDRFANMRWSILTPKRCMHWDGEAVTFSEGVDKTFAPDADAVEPLWVSYYSKIFNPARLKVRAMQAQLLKRNWKNLPEAAVIEPLIREAGRRTGGMIAKSEFHRVRESDFSTPTIPVGANWETLKERAGECRACPLWKNASCTVFGEGPVNARIVFVGEQPGDQEDRTGKPFVGPAGQVLDRALKVVGIDRSITYVTNAVKHFKFEPRGKRRIHKTASAREIAACRPWLTAELELIKPDLVVALGATAAQSLFGAPLKILQNRGAILPNSFGLPTLVTVHPSAILRLPEGMDPEVEFQKFVEDLKRVGSSIQ
ncbi:MAG: UdgX family uracil-DNA binding protein, partial [Limisphaerales bacterium]